MTQFLIEFLVSLLWWVVLFPVIWLLATPFILISAVFDERLYEQAVKEKYRKIAKIWDEWGIVFVP